MKKILFTLTILFSVSLFSADKENSWYLDTKELQCKNVIETKQISKVDLSLSGIKKINTECKNQKHRRLEGLDDVSTIACGETEYFYLRSEERCNQLAQFISINAKNWYILVYSLAKKDSPARCLYAGDPAVAKFFGPSNYVFKEGCKVLTYEPNAGLLSIDCSKNQVVSSTMPTLFYADSEPLCSNLKETYDKK
ncbi:hypothetical protein [Leptospira yasudae]|uniref:Uncharacterized protein n=1 Tax=Leptospira yasudae TaxID=2202201 RepID=A0ABX9LXA1_9LEPT|nr:hypothetical protein [Leptospira yasudae]RHX77481.1 hypothetical protein DLM77_20885 [Leptospira yasudae]